MRRQNKHMGAAGSLLMQQTSTVIMFMILLIPAYLAAQAPDRNDLDLTIFPQSGWVLDSRTVDLQEGLNEVLFFGIARQLDPGSLQLGLDGEVRSVRTRIEHQGWDRVFQQLKGREIRLVSETGQLIEGEVIDYSQGRLHLRKTNGRFTLIPNPHSYRLEFDHEPDREQPGAQLDGVLNVARTGTYPVQIYYVVNNLAWSLDYSVRLNEDEDRAEVIGTALIRNNTGTVYEDARVRLVAGDVRIQARQAPYYSDAAMGDVMMARAESVPQAEQYADHYVYELPRRLSLPERELYQFPLVKAADVDVTKIYHHGIRSFSGSSRDPQRVTILYRFENEEEQGLGQPLPAGAVRVYRESGKDAEYGQETGRRSNAASGSAASAESGGMQFLGQDRISHVAEGDPFQVMTGRAFDVRVTETAVQHDQIAPRIREEVRVIAARNERDKPVVVTLELPLHRNLTVREASLEPVSRTADRHIYELEVPAKGESAFEITLRQQN